MKASAAIAIIVAVLGSGLISSWAAPTAWSTFYVSPKFDVVVQQDLSLVEVRNNGHAAAHNAKITIRVSGNQTGFVLPFSSEDATIEVYYHREADVTLVTFNLKRMAEQASVSLSLKRYSGQVLEVWVHSDEKGAYLMAKRVTGPGQPVDYVALILGLIPQSLTSVTFYAAFFILILLFKKFFGVNYRSLWPL